MRDAYAIEYDCIDATELLPSLMSKKRDGLFFAGQINGTSGYEEAGCQGLVAGINASRYVKNQPPVIFGRDNSYIGVLIDDITTKDSFEPYRMMTSRAEHRLVLRQDNADLRLTPIGREIGLVDDNRYNRYLNKVKEIEEAGKLLNKIYPPRQLEEMFAEAGEPLHKTGLSVADALRRNGITAALIRKHLGIWQDISPEALEQVEINCKYSGYIERQQNLIEQAKKLEGKLLPDDIDYMHMDGLRLEARQKLDKIRPLNLGQASRISGVSPADVQILIVYLAQNRKK